MKVRRKTQHRSLSLALLAGLAGLVACIFYAGAGLVETPEITATLDDSLNDSVTADGKATPGETIDFTATVHNADATLSGSNVVFNTTVDANTTLVPGSVKVSPLALDDAYASIGNVGISVPVAAGLLANDVDPDGANGGGALDLEIGTLDLAGTVGAVTLVGTDGAFTYTPPPGFQGSDTFSYTIKDADNLSDASTGAGEVTVTIAVAGMVWFIDNSGPAGNGTLGSPFNSLGQHTTNSGDANGDCVFLHSGSGSYGGGIVLQNSQRLLGQGSTQDIATFCGFSVPAHSLALPATGGARPVLVNTGGNAISLSSGNTLRGFDIGNTAAASDGIAGTGVGSLSISEVAIAGSGGGVNLANGSLDITLDAVSSSGSDNGIRLENTTGAFTVAGNGNTAVQGGNNSGGIIGSTSGAGVFLANASNVTLQNMTIGDSTASPADGPSATAIIGGDGIRATMTSGLTLNNVRIARTGGHGLNADALSGLTLRDSQVLNAGNGQEEHGLNLDNLAGSNLVIDSMFDAFNETGIELVNSSGTVGLTVSGTTFQDNKSTVGNAGEEGVLVEAKGSAQIMLLITANCVFDDLASQGVQGISDGSSSELHLTIENSSFLETGAGDAVLICNPDNAGDARLLVTGCMITDDTFGPFGVLAKNDSSGEIDATLQSLTAPKVQVVAHNHDDLGSGGAANGTSRIHVENCVNLVGSENIGADFISTESVDDGILPDVSITLVNNTIQATDQGFFTFIPGIRIAAQDRCNTHLDIRGNTAVGAPSTSGANGLEIQELDAADVRVENLVGGAAAFLDGLNTIDNGTRIASGTLVAGNADAPLLPLLP